MEKKFGGSIWEIGCKSKKNVAKTVVRNGKNGSAKPEEKKMGELFCEKNIY
jgi:hypothetical protein